MNLFLFMYVLCSFIRNNAHPTCREEEWSMAMVLLPTMHFLAGVHGFRRKKRMNVHQKCAILYFLLQGSVQNQHCGLYSLSPVLLISSCPSGGCGSGQRMQLSLAECMHHRHWCQKQPQTMKQQQTKPC